ncbi:L-serine ammonia-lyase [Alloscardovia theropitheci]|uniref:L-serine dehydratase n=1 Tax=Alloscardovia theropitheci TaxID=2496842 RepID=A0A4V2MTX8_9BIFI|nr:L-serine ammonia-lyase [Alloscardovia theropitheci]TCD54199.1 L-serine ammonia-lyase [Alloscardovia theropitheci]
MLSVFDMFSIGIGPSSSHTVGPMRAAHDFISQLRDLNVLDKVARIHVTLYGSLSQTGLGHGTDRAVAAGLLGYEPETVDPSFVLHALDDCARAGNMMLAGEKEIFFAREDIEFERWETLDYHPNGMRFWAFDANDDELASDTSYSVGGGFVVHEDEIDFIEAPTPSDPSESSDIPYPFTTGKELVAMCEANNLSVSELMWANETAMHSEEELRTYLLQIWHTMRRCIFAGCTSTEMILPGGLNVRRRAPKLYSEFARSDFDIFAKNADSKRPLTNPFHDKSSWVDLFALAVNEENAGGGRIVTAPTNGAAGIVPAVLNYYWWFIDGADEEGVMKFLLAASAIGYLFKRNGSISGAEVGCQGEVGSASSMASAGLCEVLGGTPAQVENAAEIGIEHHLGLTCDPIGGLVQIPCIERNALASNTAINAARMAMLSDGSHIVSLDSAIRTMKETGNDMMSKYKETSQGGLAVNVVEC